MKHLYLISMVLQMTNAPPGQITTKLIQSYRFTETKEEALGSVMTLMKEKFPNFAVQDHLVMEIPPEEVKEVYAHQHWELSKEEEKT